MPNIHSCALALIGSLVILSGSVPSLAGAAASEPSWLAFGDMRGYIEPCGCDPATDLGGVARLQAFLRRERGLHADTLVFSLGNNLSRSDSPNDQLKSKYLNLALTELKPTAALLGASEAKRLLAIKNSSEAPVGDLTYLVSNASAKSKLSAFSQSVIKSSSAGRGTYIFGYVDPAVASGHLRRVDTKLIQDWRRLLPKTKSAPYMILLFSGSDSDLRLLQQSKMFDLIISSNRTPQNAVIDNRENLQPETLLRVVGGRAVLMVPLGGQGVLRGGRLAKTKAPSLQEIMHGEPAADGLSMLGVPVSWLDRSLEAAAYPNKMLQQYNADVTREFARQEQAKLNQATGSAFVGAEACAGCHLEAHKIWRSTKHAAAFATLEAKQKAADADCVSCHVVGFAEAGGFISLRHTPHLKDVQCESCHGPRKDHIADPVKNKGSKQQAKDVCVSCHQGMHSPEFDYATYWERIKHK